MVDAPWLVDLGQQTRRARSKSCLRRPPRAWRRRSKPLVLRPTTPSVRPQKRHCVYLRRPAHLFSTLPSLFAGSICCWRRRLGEGKSSFEFRELADHFRGVGKGIWQVRSVVRRSVRQSVLSAGFIQLPNRANHAPRPLAQTPGSAHNTAAVPVRRGLRGARSLRITQSHSTGQHAQAARQEC